MANVTVQNQRNEQARQTTGALARHEEREGYFNPFSLMRRLSDELDRAFATSFGLPNWQGRGTSLEEVATWSPAVEVTERNNNLLVRAELPGLNKEDVKVEVTNDGLAIQGEKRRQHEERERGYYRSERTYGSFYRLIPLPDGIDPDKARAQFNNGLLEVEIPIPESLQRKRREIPIKA